MTVWGVCGCWATLFYSMHVLLIPEGRKNSSEQSFFAPFEWGMKTSCRMFRCFTLHASDLVCKVFTA